MLYSTVISNMIVNFIILFFVFSKNIMCTIQSLKLAKSKFLLLCKLFNLF